jgi:UDP-N-acetylmuramate dehydrogenase
MNYRKEALPDLGWFKDNESRFSGQILYNEPLSRYTYYQIGGPAALFALPKSRSDIQWLIEGIKATQIPFFILGLGSNILVPDAGYEGLVIRASRYNLEIGTPKAQADSPHYLLRTGASVPISTLLRKASLEGWDGLEFLTGIPGSIGGAIRMNAGTHLGQTEDKLNRVEAYLLDSLATDTGHTSSTNLIVFEKSEFQFSYRKNHFLPQTALIWAVEWEIELGTPETVKDKIDKTLARRKQTQPIDMPSCGSVFKNPKASGMHAWEVIEKIGLRGHQVGQAQFSTKHCNFILNLGGAKASEVRALIELAKTKAYEKMGILLEEEVIILD